MANQSRASGSAPPSVTRRGFLAGALAASAIGFAGACAGPGGSGSSSAGPVRVRYWSSLRGAKQVTEAFNRSQNRIRVIFEQVPSGPQGGYAKLSNAARAGNAPDIATIEYPQLPGFAIDGVARDISGLVSDSLRKRLLPQALRRTTFTDKVYAVPVDFEPMVLHYRRDVFAQNGFAVPQTWDEFEQLALRVRDRMPGTVLSNFPTDQAPSFAALAAQAGARWFDATPSQWTVSITDERTRDLATYWQRLVEEKAVSTIPSEGRELDARVTKGTVLARLSGAWDAGAVISKQAALAGKWGIAPLPQWDPAAPRLGDHGGSTFAITKDCAVPEAAMEFIEWQVSTPEAVRARMSSGVSSQYPAVTDLLDVAKASLKPGYYPDQDIFALFDQEAPKVVPDWQWGPRMTATFQLMQDNFALAAAGQATLFDAARAAQSGTVTDLKSLGMTVVEQSGDKR